MHIKEDPTLDRQRKKSGREHYNSLPDFFMVAQLMHSLNFG